jgi:hypothetical protein
VIESALSIIIAGLFGYWHAPYAWVIGLSVLTALFWLVSHRAPLRIARHEGEGDNTIPLRWTHFATTAVFISINVCFLAVHFGVYFLVAWLH